MIIFWLVFWIHFRPITDPFWFQFHVHFLIRPDLDDDMFRRVFHNPFRGNGHSKRSRGRRGDMRRYKIQRTCGGDEERRLTNPLDTPVSVIQHARGMRQKGVNQEAAPEQMKLATQIPRLDPCLN